MSLSFFEITNTIPVSDTTNYRSKNKILFQQLDRTCIIIDDDPTGNQTVYDIPLLTEWDENTIINEFKKKTPVFFLLTNSRSLTSEKVYLIYKEITENIVKAATVTKRNYTIISRSDSTLRGHFPIEIDSIKEAGNFTNTITFFIPVMFEGGRVTINDTHYILDQETLIPVNKTPFAKDHTFGYSEANLKEWLREKTEGKINPTMVYSFSLGHIRTMNTAILSEQITTIPTDSYSIVNAINYNDLDKVANALLLAEQSGKKILYRTSSSFIPSYIGIAPKKLIDPKDLINTDTKTGGLLVVGSYVPKSSTQLSYILKRFPEKNTIATTSYITSIIAKTDDILAQGDDIIIYTSRKLITGATTTENAQIAAKVSEALIALINGISVRPKYIVSKGGITSHDLATKGLKMKRSTVLGQIIPGVPVWEMGNTTKFPKLPYIVFPGNVGDEKSLFTITQKLS